MPSKPIYVFGASRAKGEQQIIAHHLVFTGYGHWLSNDLRGSGSTELRNDKLAPLGEIHFGRRPIQPSRKQIKDFYRDASELLKHETHWFDAQRREVIARAFAETTQDFGYTVYAFAACSNHGHLVVRRHKDDANTIFWTFAGAAAAALRRAGLAPEDHPVWADRPYGVYLHTPADVHGRIQYVVQNPVKEGLAMQRYDFVVPYNNWPFHKALRRP